jgi:hypothetical protein
LCKLCTVSGYEQPTYRYVAVRLTFDKNRALVLNGRPPLVVTDYEKEYLSNLSDGLAQK